MPDSGDAEGKTVEIAEKSICWMSVETTGKQCHASRPDQGINAFYAASKLAARVHELYDVFNHRDELFVPPTSTFEPTKKHANVPNVNTIPGDDVFWIDCRILPNYKIDDVEAKVREWADEIEKEENVTMKCIKLNRRFAESAAARWRRCFVVWDIPRRFGAGFTRRRINRMSTPMYQISSATPESWRMSLWKGSGFKS